MKDLRGLCASATSALLFARYNFDGVFERRGHRDTETAEILHPSSFITARSDTHTSFAF